MEQFDPACNLVKLEYFCCRIFWFFFASFEIDRNTSPYEIPDYREIAYLSCAHGNDKVRKYLLEALNTAFEFHYPTVNKNILYPIAIWKKWRHANNLVIFH